MSLEQANSKLLNKIRKELNEDLKSRDNDVEIIKEWLKQEPHLPSTWDDQRILSFLRGCKFSLEKCKKKLDMYFTMRGAIPEFFSGRDITRPELQEFLKIGQGPPLPRLTPEGNRVTFFRASQKDFDIPNPVDAAKLCLMVMDIRLEAETEGVLGDVVILDAAVLSLKYFAKVSPSVAKKFLICVQKAYPNRIREVHVINVSPLVDTLVNLAKPLLSEKIRKRIYIHSDLASLYDFVPRDVLPEEYGGSCGKISDIHCEWVKKIEQYTAWFKEQENVKADESKRVGNVGNIEELFGLQGSFKKLTID